LFGGIGYCFNSIEGIDGKRLVIKERFDESFPVRPTGEEKQKLSIQYFKGVDPKNWTRNISAYSRVSMGEVYEGISVVLRTDHNNVEKVFMVKPDVPVEKIHVSIDGANDLQITEKGELRLYSGTGTLTFTKPVAYQETGADKRFVDVAYVLKDNGYGFKLGEYDPSREIIIDPLLASTVIGGMVRDYANSIDMDSNGNVYIAGETTSSDFPTTPGVYDQTYSSEDGFVVKFDANLGNLLSATFLGGSRPDVINSLHISESGDVYVGGYTQSYDLPVTANAYDKTFGGTISDAFVAKLDANLKNLLACTYIGGTNAWYDEILVLTTDGSGNVYIAGTTWASDFPVTSKGFDKTFGGGETDSFVAKMDGTLSTLIASSYLGGSQDDWINDIAIDKDGNLYLGGKTYSPNLPATAGAYDANYDGADDAYIAKVSGDLDQLMILTYLNGTTKGEDIINGIALDKTGNVYVAGSTSSKTFPVTSGAYDVTYKSGDEVFVSKFSSDLKTLLASTFLGGGQNDRCFALRLDDSGNVYITGRTDNAYNTGDFPVTTGAADTTFNGGLSDVFISKLDAGLSHLLYSSLLGGAGEEEAYSLVVNSSGVVYVTGYTKSTDFPVTADAYQLSNMEAKAKGAVAFVSKFDTGTGGSGDNNNNGDTGGDGGGRRRWVFCDSYIRKITKSHKGDID
jgi:hypothetical protein